MTKRHNAHVIQFLKTVGHPELIDLWCEKENQEQFRKLRFTKDTKDKKRLSCFFLFCMDRRPQMLEEKPFFPITRITSLMAEEWRAHRDANDEVFIKYKTMYDRQAFFDNHRDNMTERYPHFSSDEINRLLERMFQKLKTDES